MTGRGGDHFDCLGQEEEALGATFVMTPGAPADVM